MAGKEVQIEQAIEAVKRQPGSPAYAFLAEHYLEQGKVEDALRICQSGFAANPGFERGAVAYLSVLRRKGDLPTAGEVYGRAIAYLPHSARVRVAWALMLADAGKEREARIVAREALDLDPLNREARAFVATLGGTPAPLPAGRPPSSPTARLAALAKDAIFDDSDLAADEQAPRSPGAGPRAEVRPWVRPIGQRTTPHKMFDLTPVPSGMDPQDRHDLRGQDVAISPLPGGAVEVPADLFEDGREPAAPTPDRPAGSTDQPGEPVAGQAILRASGPGARPLWTTPPPTPLRASATPRPRMANPTPSSLRPVVTAPPPAPPPAPPHRGPEEQAEPPARELFPEARSADQAGAGATVHEETAAEHRLPPRREDSEVLELDETDEISEEQFDQPAGRRVLRGLAWPGAGRRSLTRLLLLGAAAALLTAGTVLGVRLYRAAALEKQVDRAVEALRPDLVAGYLAARQELGPLHACHAGNQKVTAALALVDAHLAVRFSAGEGAQRRARELLAKLPRSAWSELAAAASALLDAGQHGTRVLQDLERAGLIGRSWHAQLAASRAALAAGQRERAVQLLEQGLKLQPPAPALFEEAATFFRRAGELARARAVVTAGLRTAPSHPGLRIQEALLTAGDLPASRLEGLLREAGQVARFRAAVELLRASQARRRRALPAAVGHLQEALRVNAGDPEAAVQLAVAWLDQGGDAARAEALLARHAPAMSGFWPGVGLERAQALLLLGRPHEARRQLAALVDTGLSEPDQGRLKILKVRAAHWADQPAEVERECAAAGANQGLRAVCAESLLERDRIVKATALVRGITDSRALAYLNGLKALLQGDATRAIGHLSRAREWSLDPAAPVLALARAQARQGNPAEAVRLLREAVSRDARSARSRVALALALVAAGHDTEAQALLESLLADRPTQPSLLGHAGEAFLAMGLPDKAAALVDQGIKQDPGSLLVRLLAGRVALANHNAAEARRHFNEVLRRDPRHPEALVELGRIEEASGEVTQARRRFAAALKLRPKDPELLFLIARAQARSGDPRAAYANGNRAVRLLKAANQDSRALEVTIQLGRLLAQRDKWARQRAAELFFEATKPKNAPALPFLELGRVHRMQGDIKRAIWCFRQATERDANLAEAYLELGRTLKGKREWRKEARVALRRYLKLRPDSKEAPKVRALLEKLH